MPPRLQQSLSPIASSLPTVLDTCSSCLRKEFSSTPVAKTRLRRRMFAWLDGPGENLRHPLPNAVNYLSSYNARGELKSSNDNPTPFPLNRQFVSQSILSEGLRQEIWRRVKVDGKSVRQVSVELGVEMRRVGAVVRLVEVELRMRAEGKPLALPYARAIHSMVPVTQYSANRPVPHESINDLPMHRLTNQQIFYPTSESRAFNRTDAGRVFSGAPRLADENDIGQGGKPKYQPWEDVKPEIIGKKGSEMAVLKPTDARIPHPELIAYEQDKLDESLRGEDTEIMRRYAQRFADDANKREQLWAKRMADDEARKLRIDSTRWQFVVTDVKTTREGTGLDGRGTKSPGMRYGVPPQDRKRGQIKIPTRVEV